MNSDDYVKALNSFYQNYLVDTLHGSFQVFQSFSYGDMVISFLLLCILFTNIFKWLWEVLR